MSAGEGTPQYLETAGTDECAASFIWYSSLACPVCTTDDYYEVSNDIYISNRFQIKGSCDGGKRSVQLIRNANCNGPATIQETSESCSTFYFLTWITQ